MGLEVFSAREMQLMKDKVIVRKSCIHGRGTLASCDIPAGRVVGYYKGNVHSGEDYTFVHSWQGVDSSEVDIEVAGPLRYMNHTSEPNCWIRSEDRDPQGRPRSVIISLQDIPKGIEMTRFYNYCFEEFIRS